MGGGHQEGGEGTGGAAGRRGLPRPPLRPRAAARAATGTADPPMVHAAASCQQAPRRPPVPPPTGAGAQPRRRADRPALRGVEAARAERA